MFIVDSFGSICIYVDRNGWGSWGYVVLLLMTDKAKIPYHYKCGRGALKTFVLPLILRSVEVVMTVIVSKR